MSVKPLRGMFIECATAIEYHHNVPSHVPLYSSIPEKNIPVTSSFRTDPDRIAKVMGYPVKAMSLPKRPPDTSIFIKCYCLGSFLKLSAGSAAGVYPGPS